MSTAIAQRPFSERIIDAVQGTGQFEGLLPKQYRPMASRFLQTARLYIATCNHRDKLQKCTIGSIVTSILQAGKFGLLVDGKQAHLVPFNTKVKKEINGKMVEEWESQAQLIPDYKGLINSARRTGLILDGSADHVHEFDTFHRKMTNGIWSLDYEPALRERGDYLGTFAVLLLPDKRFTVAYMEQAEIEAIRQRSKSKDNGPWVTDWMEMAKKTAVKRVLKLYCDDPELMELVAFDNELSGIQTIDTIATETPKAGARKAPPLAIAHHEESVNFSDMVGDEPEAEPVPAKRGKAKQEKAEVPVNDYASTFATCTSLKALHECKASLLGDDPTLAMEPGFEEAFKARDGELRK